MIPRSKRTAALLAAFCAAFSVAAIGGTAAKAATVPLSGTQTATHAIHATEATEPATQTVDYLGLQFTVPADWPVIDLANAPSTCVRFDQHAVYLGTPGSRQDCPARIVGRTETLLVQPAAASAAPVRTSENPVAQEFDTIGSGFQVTVTYNTDRSSAQSILASAGLPAPSQPAPAAAAPSAPNRSATPHVAADAVVPGSTNFTGQGFDVCNTPDSSSMSAWKSSSPYSAIGIYIGGVNRTCSQPNLTSSWVSQQAGAGWKFLPLYVGLQGPGNGCGCATISSASQGTAAADDAINDAVSLGFPAGIEITYDMEAYASGGSNTALVVGFEAAWTRELHAHGFLAGVYGSMASTVADLVGNYTTATMPDVLDFASLPGSGGNTVSDPAIPAGDWPNHQRVHQYTAGHDETYGGVTLNIDGDYLDVQVSSSTAGAYTTDSDSGWSVYDPYTNATTVFGMGSTGRIGFTTGAGTNWPDWSEVSNMWLFPTSARPTGVYNPDARTMFVFARGTDGSMGVSTRPDGASGWTAWTEMNNYWKLVGDPSAAYNPTTKTMTVFARGTGGHVGFTQSVNGGRWSQWTDVNQSWTFAGDPHAIYNPDTEQVSVFARGNDGSVGVSTYVPGATWPWSDWAELNNYWKLAGDPTIAYNPVSKTLTAFARGDTGEIGFTQSVNGGRWSQWAQVNQTWTFAGDPHAVYNPDTKQVSVFGRGNDGSIGVSTYIPGATWPWSDWSELNNYWKLAGDPTIAYNPAGKTMQVFARGQGNPAQMGDTQSVNGGRWTQWNSVNLWWTFVGP